MIQTLVISFFAYVFSDHMMMFFFPPPAKARARDCGICRHRINPFVSSGLLNTLCLLLFPNRKEGLGHLCLGWLCLNQHSLSRCRMDVHVSLPLSLPPPEENMASSPLSSGTASEHRTFHVWMWVHDGCHSSAVLQSCQHEMMFTRMLLSLRVAVIDINTKYVLAVCSETSGIFRTSLKMKCFLCALVGIMS